MNKIIRYSIFALGASALVACSNQSAPYVSSDAEMPTPSVEQQQETTDPIWDTLTKQAMSLKTFQYNHNNSHYKAYISTQPELIESSDGKSVTQFLYQQGKLFAVKQDETVQLVKDNVISPELLKQGKLLQTLFSYNKADKGVSKVNTGDEAKLNYLCISKIQQVAQTKRVFRSPDNASITSNSIKGIVRLNGNQYYKLHCEIAGDFVTKLSLISK